MIPDIRNAFAQTPSQNGKIFSEINKLRDTGDQDAENERQKLDKFNEKTCSGRLARNKYFEYLTLGIIVFNALYLGYDADYSARWNKPDDLYGGDMPWGFVFMENFFCVFFTAELLIRFFGYKRKMSFVTDVAFLFDLVLVLMMVAETWPLALLGSGGALSNFSILRLLRLVRILRMGKLVRYFPELALLVKGMVAAVRSVGCASILLLLVLYVFAIIFTAEYHQGWKKDADIPDDDIAYLFGSMGKSMRHLLIMGTILDDITACMNTIRSTDKILVVLCFIIFVLISAFTLFNMLLGILCEVVEATGAGEKAKAKDKQLKETIYEFFKTMDMDSNGQITRAEFKMMEGQPEILKTLKDLNIQQEDLKKYEDLFFSPSDDDAPERSMMGKDCIAMIMKLRPGKGINCCDFSYFRKKVTEKNAQIKKYLDCIEWMVNELTPFVDEEEPERDPDFYRIPSTAVVASSETDVGPRPSKARAVEKPLMLEQTHSPRIPGVKHTQFESAGSCRPATADSIAHSGPRRQPEQNAGRSLSARVTKPMQTISALAQSPAAEAVTAAPPVGQRWKMSLNGSSDAPGSKPGTPNGYRMPESEDNVAARLQALAEKKRLRNAEVRSTVAHNASLKVGVESDVYNIGKLPRFPKVLRTAANPDAEEDFRPPFSPQQFIMD